MNKYPQAHIAREEGMAYVLTTGTCHECGPWSCLHFFQGCTVPQVCATSPLLAEELTAMGVRRHEPCVSLSSMKLLDCSHSTLAGTPPIEPSCG